MKLLALGVFGALVLIAWLFEFDLLRNLLIFGAIGIVVIQYERLFDWIFSSGSRKTRSSKEQEQLPSKRANYKANNQAYWQGSGIKNCASCQYWSGDRKIDSSRIGITFDQSESARCVGGGRDKVVVSAVQICQQYAKSSSLK